MTDSQWEAFSRFRDAFRGRTEQWMSFSPRLKELQQKAAAADTPPYPAETPVVYSTDFDKITPDMEIKLLLIGDNPGKDEQREHNRRYLVGQSGKIAEGFFKKNPELGICFRQNTLILNKTPVHTAKTMHLRYLAAQDKDIAALIRESQIWMAERTALLHQELCRSSECALWLIGYGELKNKGIFTDYRRVFSDMYSAEVSLQEAWNNVLVFRHFSMNSFLIELKKFTAMQEEQGHLEPLQQRLYRIGSAHRREIFGK